MNKKLDKEFNELIEESKKYWYTDLKKSFEIMAQALDVAKKNDSDLSFAVVYNGLGNLYTLSNKFEQALEYYQKSLSLFKNLKLLKRVSSVLNNIGNIYFHMGKYHDATNYYEKSLQLKLDFNDSESIAKALNNLASAYTRLGLYKLALEHFLKALKFREDLDNDENKATSLMNIGGLYMQLKDYTNAKKYLNLAYKLYSKDSNSINMAYILTNMSIIYRDEEKYAKSEEILKKAISVKREIGYEVSIPSDYFNLGLTYFLWKKYEEAKVTFEKTLELAKAIKDDNSICYSMIYLSKLSDNFEDTQKFLFSALEIALKQNNKHELLMIYQYLNELYEDEKLYEKSYNYYKKYIEIKNEIESEETNRELMELQKKYDIEKKIKENEILEKENKFLKAKIEAQQKLNKAEQTIEKQKYKIELISRELSGKIERNLIGNSNAIKDVLKLAMTCASYRDVSVLITGENGTGKEIIARIIHYASARKNNMFFPVNCAAVPENLLESEFFGHAKGAFTGAHKEKKGIFELANQGTLFLDEIADMPYLLQGKLLRVLEDKRVNKVGSGRTSNVDVRIISATNKDILKLVDENKFRIDFFHRINTINIHIPPLRERPDDIQPLLFYYVEYFSKMFNKPMPKIEKSLIKHLTDYSFPGNVRELKNLVERAIILATTTILTKDDFPIKKIALTNSNTIRKDSIAEINLIKKVMRENNFNQSKAAAQLGISRDALIRKMRKYNLKVKREIS